MLRPVMIGAVLLVASAALADDPKPGVSLTIYNNNFGVVKETRELDLADRVSTLQFRDVARRIDATSVHFKSLTDPEGTKVLEQNYEFDLVSADKLLDKYIDRAIAVHTEDGRYAGKLMSFDRNQLVLMGDDGGLEMIQRADNVTHIGFGELPEGLLTRPTLVWQVATAKPGKHLAQVTYQTTGMSWVADYNVVLNAADTAMDLSGWVTVTNRSGASYESANVKLIAGDVRRVQPSPRPGLMMERAMVKSDTDARNGGFEQKSFFEYHLYTLGRPTTVKDNQVKQIELLTANAAPVTKRYVFEPGGANWHRKYGDKNIYKVNVYIEFTNDEASKLGMPLPKGKVRVYKRDDADGELEFVGEDRIDHTPRNEELRLYIGDAFDLVGEKNILKQESGKRWRKQDVEIKLRNQKEQGAATIRVREKLGTNWKITNSSHEFKKVDAFTAQFDVPVEAEKEAVVTYTVEYNW